MSEVMTLLTSASGHALVKSFSGTDVTQQPFSTGKLFNLAEEPVSDLQSLSALLQRLENDPKHTVIRGSLTDRWITRQPRPQFIVRTAAFQPEPKMHINSRLNAHAG